MGGAKAGKRNRNLQQAGQAVNLQEEMDATSTKPDVTCHL
jgi:hypothetical protein